MYFYDYHVARMNIKFLLYFDLHVFFLVRDVKWDNEIVFDTSVSQ